MATDLYFLPMTQNSSHWFSWGIPGRRPRAGRNWHEGRGLLRENPLGDLPNESGDIDLRRQLVTHCGFLQRRQRSASSIAVSPIAAQGHLVKFRPVRLDPGAAPRDGGWRSGLVRSALFSPGTSLAAAVLVIIIQCFFLPSAVHFLAGHHFVPIDLVTVEIDPLGAAKRVPPATVT